MPESDTPPGDGQRDEPAGELLTTAQKRSFKRNGFLVVSDAVDEHLVTAGRELLERLQRDGLTRNDDGSVREIHVPDDLGFGPDSRVHDPNTSDSRITKWNFSPPAGDPFESIHRQVHEYVEALVGEGSLPVPTETPPAGFNRATIIMRDMERDVLADPHAPQPSERSGTAHLDGINTGRGSLVIGATLYYDRIEPRGGGFTAYPGSHWNAARFYEAHPFGNDDLANGSSLPAITEDGGWDYDRRLADQMDPFEVTGEAGTLVLWHGLVEHLNGPVSLSPSNGTMRKAEFLRWFASETLDDEYDWEEAASDPFKYWDGMGEIDLDADPAPDLSNG